MAEPAATRRQCLLGRAIDKALELGSFNSCEGLGVRGGPRAARGGRQQRLRLAAADADQVHEHQAQPSGLRGHEPSRRVARRHTPAGRAQDGQDHGDDGGRGRRRRPGSFSGSIPVRWTGPSLNAESPKIATETIEIAHHGFLPGGRSQMTDAIALPAAAERRPPGWPAPAPSGDRSRPRRWTGPTLKLYDPTPSKSGSGGTPGAERGSIAFQFNPKEVTIAKSAKWERKTAKGAKKAGPPEFSGAEPCKLTVEMFFDATGTHDGSVVAAVEKLFACCVPTEESAGQKKPTPPLVVLHWGRTTSFPAFVTIGEREVHALQRRRHADPGHVQRCPGGDARRAAAAEPDLGRRCGPPGAHGHRG